MAAPAITLLLPLIANILQSGMASALSANAAGRANNEQVRLLQRRRAELQPIVDQLKQAQDYTQLEEQMVRDFSRASDQMAAQSAQTGMTNAGSGGLDQVRRDVLGAMIASLAQQKAADEQQRQAMLVDILADPAFHGGGMAMNNVGMDTLLAGLGGGLAGAGSTLASFLTTKEGLAVLGALGQKQADPNLMNSQLFQGQSAVAPGGRHVFNGYTTGAYRPLPLAGGYGGATNMTVHSPLP